MRLRLAGAGRPTCCTWRGWRSRGDARACRRGELALASLPYWLPGAVVGLRVRIFTHAGGDEAVAIPGRAVDAAHFEEVYAHPAANGRSRGAALSDLFWYWLSPGPELHQEHLEPGARYDEVARTTRRLLARPHATVEALAADCTARVLDERPVTALRLVRLRDLMMPIWAEFAYELVFGERCPRRARELIVGNANDVVTALKCTGLRHMGRRHRLTEYLVDRIEHGPEPQQPLPGGLSTRERALYLQGAFFNTAVVQMSEAMAHLLMVLAQHPDAQERAAAAPDDVRHLDRVLDETLRLYPLFGIAHRITSADIAVDGHTIPPGSVLCFNYPVYHRTGYDDPDAFRPERWEGLSHHDAAFIPFGVAGNRPCPARGLAPVAMRAATREVLRRLAPASSASHTRSIPNRGPCVLVSRMARPRPRLRLRLLLAFVRVRDRWEDVWRSLVQLVLGTYMVWDARRLRLCERHFEAADEAAGSPAARPPRRPRGARDPGAPQSRATGTGRTRGAGGRRLA